MYEMQSLARVLFFDIENANHRESVQFAMYFAPSDKLTPEHQIVAT